MGALCPFALYRDLLQDLAPYLYPGDSEVLEREPGNLPYNCEESIQRRAAVSLAKSFLKKNEDLTTSRANDNALQKFLAINNRCKEWRLCLNTSWDEILLGELKRTLDDFCNPRGFPILPDYTEAFRFFRCGPGKSIGAKQTDLYHKVFGGPLTSTSQGLYRLYRSNIRHDQRWFDAENFRQDQHGSVVVCEGSRLSFVPKNADISRIVCVEPTLNMGYQLGVGEILTSRLRSFFGIDLTKQPDYNRELCRLGSLSGSFATIDLESASDSLSLSMLKEVFPMSFLGMLLPLRCSTTKLPSGEAVALHMISTMGNGFTFPLQTILFAGIVSAAARARGFHLSRPHTANLGAFGVFGDDIIVPTGEHLCIGTQVPYRDFSQALYRDVIRLLNILGFKVNTEKTFLEGPFRESCGVDYYNGVNVRGVYIKSLRSPQDRYVAINSLNRWSARTGISLPKTVRALLRTVKHIHVPRWESHDSGVQVPLCMVQQLRFHKDFQSLIYRRWVPRKHSISVSEEGAQAFNPIGLWLAHLYGLVREGRINLKPKAYGRFDLRSGIAPSWDDTDSTSSSKLDGMRWRTAVRSNICT